MNQPVAVCWNQLIRKNVQMDTNVLYLCCHSRGAKCSKVALLFSMVQLALSWRTCEVERWKYHKIQLGWFVFWRPDSHARRRFEFRSRTNQECYMFAVVQFRVNFSISLSLSLCFSISMCVSRFLSLSVRSPECVSCDYRAKNIFFQFYLSNRRSEVTNFYIHRRLSSGSMTTARMIGSRRIGSALSILYIHVSRPWERSTRPIRRNKQRMCVVYCKIYYK